MNEIVFANRDDIQQYLDEKYWNNAYNYKIPKDFLVNHTKIVTLIFDSVSLSSKEEKQHWFDLAIEMDEEQKNKLYDILYREKTKMNSIQNVAIASCKRKWIFVGCFLVFFFLFQGIIYYFKPNLLVQRQINQEQIVEVKNASYEVLQQYIHEEFLDEVGYYNIPEDFVVQYPNIVELILLSKSLSGHEEKQYWFDLYLQMNEEQINNLKDILIKENEKFKEIDEKYGTNYANSIVEY